MVGFIKVTTSTTLTILLRQSGRTTTHLRFKYKPNLAGPTKNPRVHLSLYAHFARFSHTGNVEPPKRGFDPRSGRQFERGLAFEMKFSGKWF